MRCKRCAGIAFEMLARGQADLAAMIEIVREAVRSGAIESVAPAAGVALTPPPAFMELDITSSWPDLLDYRFVCPACGREFRLAAETYHGSTGLWRSRAAGD